MGEGEDCVREDGQRVSTVSPGGDRDEVRADCEAMGRK